MLITAFRRIICRLLSTKPSWTDGGVCGAALVAERRAAEKTTRGVCFVFNLLKLGDSHIPAPKVVQRICLNGIERWNLYPTNRATIPYCLSHVGTFLFILRASPTPTARLMPTWSDLYGAFEVKHLFAACSTSFLSFFLFLVSSFLAVSLFDLESRFFAPTHTWWRSARAGAVKAGRRSALAAGSVASRPRLDRPCARRHAHCGRDDDQRGARFSDADHRAANLYSVGQ